MSRMTTSSGHAPLLPGVQQRVIALPEYQTEPTPSGHYGHFDIRWRSGIELNVWCSRLVSPSKGGRGLSSVV